MGCSGPVSVPFYPGSLTRPALRTWPLLCEPRWNLGGAFLGRAAYPVVVFRGSKPAPLTSRGRKRGLPVCKQCANRIPARQIRRMCVWQFSLARNLGRLYNLG
jgi:hypothetical protein